MDESGWRERERDKNRISIDVSVWICIHFTFFSLYYLYGWISNIFYVRVCTESEKETLAPTWINSKNINLMERRRKKRSNNRTQQKIMINFNAAWKTRKHTQNTPFLFLSLCLTIFSFNLQLKLRKITIFCTGMLKKQNDDPKVVVCRSLLFYICTFFVLLRFLCGTCVLHFTQLLNKTHSNFSRKLLTPNWFIGTPHASAKHTHATARQIVSKFFKNDSVNLV